MNNIEIENKNKIEKNNYWYKLDNAARVFPAILSKRYTSIFRLSVIMKSSVRVAGLQFALENIIERFPYFKVKLKKGAFWNYLETNSKTPHVYKEFMYPCMEVAGKHSNKFLFFGLHNQYPLHAGSRRPIRLQHGNASG